jgi:hypothetical protein
MSPTHILLKDDGSVEFGAVAIAFVLSRLVHVATVVGRTECREAPARNAQRATANDKDRINA